MFQKAFVQLRWLTAAEGGRKQPIVGRCRYTPTAQFTGEKKQFSILLDFAIEKPNPTEGTLSLLCPDLKDIYRRIVPGRHLEIMEGSRVVADCTVLSLEAETRETAKA
jgi:hypothetical protein